MAGLTPPKDGRARAPAVYVPMDDQPMVLLPGTLPGGYAHIPKVVGKCEVMVGKCEVMGHGLVHPGWAKRDVCMCIQKGVGTVHGLRIPKDVSQGYVKRNV